MDQFKLTINLAKVDQQDAVLMKNIVNDVQLYDRDLGDDGETLKVKNSTGLEEVVLRGTGTFLLIESHWENSDQAAGIVAGARAPVEVQLQVAGVWSTSWLPGSRFTFEDCGTITGFRVRNPDATDHVSKVRFIHGAV